MFVTIGGVSHVVVQFDIQEAVKQLKELITNKLSLETHEVYLTTGTKLLCDHQVLCDLGVQKKANLFLNFRVTGGHPKNLQVSNNCCGWPSEPTKANNQLAPPDVPGKPRALYCSVMLFCPQFPPQVAAGGASFNGSFQNPPKPIPFKEPAINDSFKQFHQSVPLQLHENCLHQSRTFGAWNTHQHYAGKRKPLQSLQVDHAGFNNHPQFVKVRKQASSLFFDGKVRQQRRLNNEHGHHDVLSQKFCKLSGAQQVFQDPQGVPVAHYSQQPQAQQSQSHMLDWAASFCPPQAFTSVSVPNSGFQSQ